MKTSKEERDGWLKAVYPGGSTERLIADVDEATLLLHGLNEASRLRSLLIATCEACGAENNISHSPTCQRVAADIFLKEPSG